jgi:Tol biopolymer transport system component
MVADHRRDPQPDANIAFRPWSWSPDGQRLAGIATRPDGTTAGVATYDVATRHFTLFPSTTATWVSAVWLPDSQRFLARDDRGVWVVDTRTRARKLVVTVGGYSVGRSVGVTTDGRWITYTETATEGEIWLATMKK